MQIPKAQKDSQVISVFLGSAPTKATHKMLVKLTSAEFHLTLFMPMSLYNYSFMRFSNDFFRDLLSSLYNM